MKIKNETLILCILELAIFALVGLNKGLNKINNELKDEKYQYYRELDACTKELNKYLLYSTEL